MLTVTRFCQPIFGKELHGVEMSREKRKISQIRFMYFKILFKAFQFKKIYIHVQLTIQSLKLLDWNSCTNILLTNVDFSCHVKPQNF